MPPRRNQRKERQEPRANGLAMTVMVGLEEVRNRIKELRQEIENLRKLDEEQRLSRQSQVPWDAQKQH